MGTSVPFPLLATALIGYCMMCICQNRRRNFVRRTHRRQRATALRVTTLLGSSTPRRQFSRLGAFTLLEVILALAILAGSIAVLGEAMSIAGRNAADAQGEAQAQLLASSVMNELLSGMAELVSQSRQPLDVDAAIPWVYSVTLDNTALAGLMSIEVVVEQDIEKQFHPVKFRLVRWLSTESDAGLEQEVSDTGQTVSVKGPNHA